MKKILFLICATLALNASAQNESNIEKHEDKEGLDKKVTKVVMSPLADLNVGNDDIPGILLNAKEQPYSLPEDKTCANLQNEIKRLDNVLGIDIDEVRTKVKLGLMQQGTELAENAAVSSIKRTVQDAIPYRNWIRKFSGAEKYEKKVSSAIAGGKARRAFLKGYAIGAGCNLETELIVESSVVEHQE
jgi:hypothetical protein